MANRLNDTEIWKKDWFLELTDKQKLLTKFLFDNCDCAGFYKISWRLLGIFFNDLPTRNDFEQIKQVRFIDDDLIFIEDFIFYQYKVKSFSELNPRNNAHKGVLKLLEKYNIYLAPHEPLTSPLLGAQDKDKDKEKDILLNNEDIFFNKNIQKVISLYKELCTDLIPIQFEHRTRERLIEIYEFLKVVGLDFNYVSELFRRANKQKIFYENRINLKSLIKNHEAIFAGLGGERPQGNTQKANVSNADLDKMLNEVRGRA